MNNGEKVALYLARIGFTGHPSKTYDTLHRLQRLHLQSIPYENLDIMRNIPLSLEPDDLFEKMIVRKRGGYCFELNGLFAWLLRTLGFSVTEYMSRFLRDETTIPMRRHRVLRVGLDSSKNGSMGNANNTGNVNGCMEYLCDVGVGGIVPRKPIPLVCGAVSEQGKEKYKLEKEPFYGYVLYEWRHDAWAQLYAFTEEEQLNIDYIMPSYYCEKHPDSFFRTTDMVHLFTENGRKSVSGREIRLFSPGGVEIINPTDESEYEHLLLTHFGIKL